MTHARITVGCAASEQEILALYTSVGWSAYSRDQKALVRAIDNSDFVACARVGEELAGLVRVLSDDVAIAWVQDLLVAPPHQRSGIGRELMRAVDARYGHVRTLALMTDDEPKQRAFYRSLGLTEIGEHPSGALRCFLRTR